MSLLHHVALGAVNVAKVAEFYQAAFGLAEVARHVFDDDSLRSIWLDLGGSVLMIEWTSNLAPPKDGVSPGPFLLAFTVPQSIHQERSAALAALGAPCEDKTDFTTYHRDPEGNRIALSHFHSLNPGSRTSAEARGTSLCLVEGLVSASNLGE